MVRGILLDNTTQPATVSTPPRTARRKWWICFAVLIAIAVYLLKIVDMWANEEHFWFDPAPAEYGNWNPSDLGYEDTWFTSADGTRLHGWYVPHEEPRAVMLYCHGAGGNLSYRADLLRHLHDTLQLSVMSFDYRGFGKSEGEWHGEQGLFDDAQAARAWLSRRTGIEPGEILLCGRSLGTAVAVALATDGGARGLILESTFSSFEDVSRHFYRWIPFRPPMRNPLHILDKIERCHVPLFQSHSRDDDVVPVELAEQVFAAANEPKTFLAFEGLRHTDPQPDAYYEALDAFINDLP